MYGLKQKLLEEEKCLKEILSGIGEPKADALEGTLRISMDKNKVRYFHHFPNENNKKKDIYISMIMKLNSYIQKNILRDRS